MTFINGNVSHWMTNQHRQDEIADTRELPESADLVVVGGGLTGLWTAYYYALRFRDARVVVLEAETTGFGASGRNGGWLSALLPGNRAVYARRSSSGADGVRRFQRSMIETIDEVVRVVEHESIAADLHRGGHLQAAPTPAAVERLRRARAGHLEFGYQPNEVVLLDAAQARDRIDIANVRGGLYFPATTRVDPAKLTLGLADVLRRMGIEIHERTAATKISPSLVTTARGDVNARHIAICLEAYGPALNGGRALIPVNSSMIVTHPLTPQDWSRIGWEGRECLNDAAHAFVYAQRTADDRIAIGGRGTPYQFGSGLPGEGIVDATTIDQLTARLHTMFPDVSLSIAHAWRGAIGVTRDWCATVRHDPNTGIATTYGYAGHGLAATNLAARTMVERMAGETTPLTTLPWNDHRARSWEPEPIRWLGVHGMYRLFSLADRWEESRRSDSTSALARFGTRLAGLHE